MASQGVKMTFFVFFFLNDLGWSEWLDLLTIYCHCAVHRVTQYVCLYFVGLPSGSN